MAKTTPRNAFTALTLTGLSLIAPLAGATQAFATEAPAATSAVTLNPTLAGSKLTVTGGEGEVQTLTNGRIGVNRQVALTIPNKDGALKAGQTTEIELTPTLAAGSQGKQNPSNLLFSTKMTEVVDANGVKIGVLSNSPTNPRAVRITWTDAITNYPRDISANFTATIDPLNDEQVLKTYDLQYKATGVPTIDGGKINLAPAPKAPNFIPPGGVWYGGGGAAKCGVNDAFLKGQTVPNGVVKGGTYEIEFLINKADQRFRIGLDGADSYLKDNPNFAAIYSIPTKEIGGRFYYLYGKELAQWGKDNPEARELFTVNRGITQDEWVNGTYDVNTVSNDLSVRAATGSYTNATAGELEKRGVTTPLVTIDWAKSTSDKLVLKYTARYDGESFWFSTTSAPANDKSAWGASIANDKPRCGDVVLTTEAVRAKKGVFSFEAHTYRTDVEGRPQTGWISGGGGYSYEDGSAEANALPKDGNESKNGKYGEVLKANLVENSSTPNPYTIKNDRTVFADTPGATISENGKKITVPGKAVITIDANGVATATPEKGFSGDLTLNYNVYDSGDATTKMPSKVTFSWSKQSTLVVAPAEKTVAVNSDKSVTLDPLATAKVDGSEIDTSTLKVGGSSSYTFGDSGVTAQVVNGKVQFTHPQNIVGDFTVPYTVTTKDGVQAQSTVTLHVTPVNTSIGIVTKINGDDANTTPVQLKVGDDGKATGKVTVELTNKSDSAVTLNESNLTVSSKSGSKVALPAGFTLAPGETKTLTVDAVSLKSGESTEVVYSATQTANVFKKWDGSKVAGTVGSAQAVSDPAKATANVVSEVPGNPPVVENLPEATFVEPKANNDSFTIDSDNPTVLEDIIKNDVGGKINGEDDPLDVKTLRFLDENGKPVTERSFPEGTYRVDENGVITFTRTAGFKGDLPSVKYTVSTVSGLSAQAEISLTNVFKEVPVEPEAPKPAEPIVEKPSEPVKKVEAKTGHDGGVSTSPVALGGMFAVVAAGGALALRSRKHSDES